MNSKKIVLVILIFLCLVTLIQAQSKGTIVFVVRMDTVVVDPETGEWPDMTWVHFLEDEGYEVIKMSHPQPLSTAEQATYDTLNNANLVIIGRSVPTLTLGGDGTTGAADKIAWNDIPTPILTGNMWALRNTRLNWFNTATITGYTTDEGAVYNAVIDDEAKDDPVFAGLDTSAPIPWAAGLIDVIGDATTDAGNSKVLARMETGELLFARFEPYEYFYEGATDLPAGPRSYIGNGRDASSLPPFNYFPFTEESEKVLLAEVSRMVVLGGGPAPDKIENENTITPSAFKLFQNYPNPFNPATTIEYNIPKTSFVSLTVYNAKGQVIEQLVNQQQEPGIYTVTWDASSMPSGVYFYRIQAGDFQQVNKCLLIK
jgi:hypothetical protein